MRAWTDYYETTASVQLAGPAVLTGITRDLQAAVMKYSMKLIDWQNDDPGVRTREEWLAVLGPLARDALAARALYIDRSVEVFSPEG